jgi:hypothetical protein
MAGRHSVRTARSRLPDPTPRVPVTTGGSILHRRYGVNSQPALTSSPTAPWAPLAINWGSGARCLRLMADGIDRDCAWFRRRDPFDERALTLRPGCERGRTIASGAPFGHQEKRPRLAEWMRCIGITSAPPEVATQRRANAIARAIAWLQHSRHPARSPSRGTSRTSRTARPRLGARLSCTIPPRQPPAACGAAPPAHKPAAGAAPVRGRLVSHRRMQRGERYLTPNSHSDPRQGFGQRRRAARKRELAGSFCMGGPGLEPGASCL